MIENPSLGDVVSSFQLSKRVVDVSNINFRDPIEDPIAVIADTLSSDISYTTWQNPSGGNPRLHIYPSEDSSNNNQSFWLNKYSSNGAWTLNSAAIYISEEVAGVGREYEYSKNDFDSLGFQTEFNVIGGLSDITPP